MKWACHQSHGVLPAIFYIWTLVCKSNAETKHCTKKRVTASASRNCVTQQQFTTEAFHLLLDLVCQYARWCRQRLTDFDCFQRSSMPANRCRSHITVTITMTVCLSNTPTWAHCNWLLSDIRRGLWKCVTHIKSALSERRVVMMDKRGNVNM